MIRRNRWWSQGLLVTIASLVAIVGWEAVSEDSPPADAPHRIPVALVDIAEVFKKCESFNVELNRMKKEVDLFDIEVKVRQEEIKVLQDESAGSAPASGQPSDARAKAAKLMADLQAHVAARRQGFLAEESRHYFNTYQRIEAVIRRLAKARDVGVVFRYNSDAIDPANRDSVMRGVNRAVVYCDVPDLTAEVVAELNQD